MNEPTHPLVLWTGYQAGVEFAFDQPVPTPYLHRELQRHHKELSAWLIRKGRVELTSDQDHAVALPGQWLICIGNKIVQNMSDDTHILSLRLHVEWPFGPAFLKGSTLQLLHGSEWPNLEAKALDLVKSVPQLDFTSPHRFFHQGQWINDFSFKEFLLYRERLHSWMGELVKALLAVGREFYDPNAVDPRLKEALSFLEHYPPSALFPRETLERIGGVQLKRLNQLCTDAFSFTLHGLWDQRRYRYAQQALRLPYLTIKEIASNLGFTRLPHFSGWFRSHRGLSPRAFRQLIQKGDSRSV